MTKRRPGKAGTPAKLLLLLICVAALATLAMGIYALINRPTAPARGSANMPGQAQQGQQQQPASSGS